MSKKTLNHFIIIFGCACISFISDNCSALFYGGLNLGPNQYSHKVKTRSSATADLSPGLLTVTVVDGKLVPSREIVVQGTTFLGYSYETSSDGFFFGPEVFLNIQSHHKRVSFNSGPVIRTSNDFFFVLKTKNDVRLNKAEVGIDLVPRFKVLTDMFIFGRVGFAYNHIKMTTTAVFDCNDEGNQPTTSILQINRQKKRINLRLGVGLEQKFYENWALNINYIYTDYGKVRFSGTANTVINSFISGTTNTVPDGLKNQTEVKLRSQGIFIGLTYFFSA